MHILSHGPEPLKILKYSIIFDTMGEIKIIIWVVLGIIYLISRARKKPAPGSAPKPAEDYSEEKPVTFEELLKEIQASKAPKPLVQPAFEPVADYKTEDYDDDLSEEQQPLEKADYSYRNQDTIYETYENAKKEAFARTSLEESLKLENTIVRFGQFKGYEQHVRPSLASVYGKELRDQTNFRKAFILSEILNRKF
jgi:hypothetical protein